MYEWSDMNELERALLHFGNRIDVIVALQQGDKLSEEDAYHEIKSLYKHLKEVRKQTK
jgi:hypothetical protein